MDFVSFSPQATEVPKLSPGLQLDIPVGLLPGLQLVMLSLHYQEFGFPQ